MHATIDVRFMISIDEDKTIPLATIAEFLTDQNTCSERQYACSFPKKPSKQQSTLTKWVKLYNTGTDAGYESAIHPTSPGNEFQEHRLTSIFDGSVVHTINRVQEF